jgi:hypothetical protein
MILTTFYTDILERLQAKVPGLKHIDLWNYQLDMKGEQDDEALPFQLPAAFVAFSPISWKSSGRFVQRGDLSFSIIVATENMAEVSSQETVEARNRGLEHLNMLDLVFQALHGYTKDNYFSSIKRADNEFDHEYTNLYSNSIGFKATLTDNSAKPVRINLQNVGQKIIPDVIP